MTQDEAAALQALVRSLGWKVLQREMARGGEALVSSILSPSTQDQKRHDDVLRLAGRREVLGWPAQALAAFREEHGEQGTIVRAGVGAVSEEG